MNRPIEAPCEALLELIHRSASDHADTVLSQAREQARERIRAAFREARQRVARAIAGERLRASGLLANHEAQLETHDRQRYQDAVQHLLTRARHRLGPALMARWARADGRQQWLEQLLDQAGRRLPRGTWTLEHPADWDPVEVRRWRDRIEAATGHAPAARACSELRAGVRILAGGACLDGTLDGLLADEGKVRARLLARLEMALVKTGAGASP